MTDWRTRPRTGKSEFYPLMTEIQNRLTQGQTYKQIHDYLTEQGLLKIGYDQFTRYIRNHMNSDKPEKPTLTVPVEKEPKPADESHPFFRPQVPKDGERRRNNDKEFHNSVPDREKIYGVDPSGEER